MPYTRPDKPTRARRAHLSDVPAFALHQAVDDYMRQLGPSWRLRPLPAGDGYALEQRKRVPDPGVKGAKVSTWVLDASYATLADLAAGRGLEVKP